MENIAFTIGIPPRTKKNSQQIIMIGGKPRIIPSKLYKQYEKDCGVFMPSIDAIDMPVNVQAVYYMPTRRKVDLCNLHEALCDVLVHYGIVADDNSKIIATMDGSRVEYDKNNPRTEVVISYVIERDNEPQSRESDNILYPELSSSKKIKNARMTNEDIYRRYATTIGRKGW